MFYLLIAQSVVLVCADSFRVAQMCEAAIQDARQAVHVTHLHPFAEADPLHRRRPARHLPGFTGDMLRKASFGGDNLTTGATVATIKMWPGLPVSANFHAYS